MIIKLHRYWQDDNQTSGICTILDQSNFPLFSSLSLERGWRNNDRNVSCIPKGVYDVVWEYSPRFKQYLWEIKGVENRSECKFHASNFWYQLNGCIALGLKYKKINSDNYRDVTNSKNTLDAFHTVLKNSNKVTLIISSEPTIK